jgi:hypothetical protein
VSYFGIYLMKKIYVSINAIPKIILFSYSWRLWTLIKFIDYINNCIVKAQSDVIDAHLVSLSRVAFIQLKTTNHETHKYKSKQSENENMCYIVDCA